MPFKNLDQLIGIRLKFFRELKDVSQDQLAAFLKISVDQVRQYESGNDRIPAKTLFALSNYFEIPLKSFFDETDGDGCAVTSYQDLTNDDVILYEQMLKLIRAFMTVDDRETRDLIVSLAEKLVK
jgi:transcriptional regulator with XRE-family HTH domain